MKNTALLFVSTYLALLCAEAYLHVFHNYKGTQIESINGEVRDYRDQFRGLLDLRSSGIEAYPSIAPIKYLEDNAKNNYSNLVPLGGISKVTTVYCNELKKLIIYDSDRYGFNNDDNVWMVPTDIFIVGDSFAQGACVSRRNTITNVLKIFSKKSVLNVGMNGNGPLLELASLIEYGRYTKPKIILWLYYEENDLVDLENETKHQLLYKYLFSKHMGNIIEQQDEIDVILKTYIHNNPKYQKIVRAVKTNTTLDSIVRFRNIRAVVNNIFKNRQIKQKEKKYTERTRRKYNVGAFEKVMERAIQTVNEWNGNFVFVYLPSWRRYSEGLQFNKVAVVSMLNKLKIPVIDLHKRFAKHPDPRIYYSDLEKGGHYNIEGYRVVAEYIWKELQRIKLEYSVEKEEKVGFQGMNF